MHLGDDDRRVLEATLAPYLATDDVRGMGAFVQHGTVSTLDHCLSVARASLWLSRALRIRVDDETMLVGALLHDFFLYDWHGAGWRHSYRHAEVARRNAVERFGVGAGVQHVIRSHMWPLGITHVPRTREAVVVCVADKCVALRETVRGLGRRARAMVRGRSGARP